MDHDEIRTRLSAYKDGELNEILKDRLSRHLHSCESCREELRKLDQLDSLVKGFPEISPSQSFTSKIIAGTNAAQPVPCEVLSLPGRIFDRFLRLTDSVFALFPGRTTLRTGALDEFGDFPPLSLSYAYFQVIGR